MPRRYRGRRRYRPRRPRQPPFLRYATMAYSAYRTANKLKGIINSELHAHDTSLTSAISSTGVVTHLSNIDQGDDVGNRQGRSLLA